MHVLDHLIEEHRKAERLLDQLAAATDNQRSRLIGELEEALTVHMAVEEMFVYPVASRVLDDDEVREADAEHALARDGLAQLRNHADQPGFGAVVDMMRAGIGHHVGEEETQMFPRLRDRAGEELGALDPEDLEQRARREHDGASRTSDKTRDELYREARAADLPGRSQMTKDELAEALEHQT